MRLATDADLPGGRGVADRTRRTRRAGLIPDADIEAVLADAYGEECLRLVLGGLGQGFVVAVEGGEVVGYAMTGGSRDGVAELFAIYVLPERQRCGVGRRLRERALDRAGGRLLWVGRVGPGGERRRATLPRAVGARPAEERDFPVGTGPVREVGYRVSVRPDTDQMDPSRV